MTRAWTYVMATDSGAAPNFGPPLTTLAICKPLIRRNARPDDLVLAFCGKALGEDPHAVRWAGVVSEVLSFTEYWQDPRFASKKPDASPTPDNIYAPAGLQFRQVANCSHGPCNADADLKGRHVLIFGRAWHFSSVPPRLPDTFGLWMQTGRRGHRVTDLSPPVATRLLEWLDENRALQSLEANASPQARGRQRGCSAPPRCGRC